MSEFKVELVHGPMHGSVIESVEVPTRLIIHTQEEDRTTKAHFYGDGAYPEFEEGRLLLRYSGEHR